MSEQIVQFIRIKIEYVQEGTTTVKTESGDSFETTLWHYDPDCEHELDPHNWSGMKCLHCPGWFCY